MSLPPPDFSIPPPQFSVPPPGNPPGVPVVGQAPLFTHPPPFIPRNSHPLDVPPPPYVNVSTPVAGPYIPPPPPVYPPPAVNVPLYLPPPVLTDYSYPESSPFNMEPPSSVSGSYTYTRAGSTASDYGSYNQYIKSSGTSRESSASRLRYSPSRERDRYEERDSRYGRGRRYRRSSRSPSSSPSSRYGRSPSRLSRRDKEEQYRREKYAERRYESRKRERSERYRSPSSHRDKSQHRSYDSRDDGLRFRPPDRYHSRPRESHSRSHMREPSPRSSRDSTPSKPVSDREKILNDYR